MLHHHTRLQRLHRMLLIHHPVSAPPYLRLRKPGKKASEAPKESKTRQDRTEHIFFYLKIKRIPFFLFFSSSSFGWLFYIHFLSPFSLFYCCYCQFPLSNIFFRITGFCGFLYSLSFYSMILCPAFQDASLLFSLYSN